MSGKIYEINKKAKRDYDIVDTFEAGISLLGSEVKSLKQGGLSLRESYIQVKTGEIFLFGAHISPYEFTGVQAPDPYRSRKLLLHKNEIEKISHRSQSKGLTIVPLKCYANNKGRIKLEIALAKGRKSHDKRISEKEKQVNRSLDRVLKSHR